VCLIYALPDKYHREVGGWTYSRKAQRLREMTPGISDYELLRGKFESDVEAVFTDNSFTLARMSLLLGWFALAGSASMVVAAFLLFCERTRTRPAGSLDARIQSLVHEVDNSLREELRKCLRSSGKIRPISKRSWILMSRLGLEVHVLAIPRARGKTALRQSVFLYRGSGCQELLQRDVGFVPHHALACWIGPDLVQIAAISAANSFLATAPRLQENRLSEGRFSPARGIART